MGLQNFIKIHSDHKENIYNALVDIFDNITGDNKERTQQSNST